MRGTWNVGAEITRLRARCAAGAGTARCLSPHIHQELLIPQTLSLSSYAAIPPLSHPLCAPRVLYLKSAQLTAMFAMLFHPPFPSMTPLPIFAKWVKIRPPGKRISVSMPRYQQGRLPQFTQIADV